MNGTAPKPKYEGKVPINVRVTVLEHRLLLRAALLTGDLNPTTFMRAAALEKAERLLADK